MEKKNLVVKKEKVVLLNSNYLFFIKDLINSKIEVSKNNKELIENKYSEIVNLRFNNIERVIKRVNRKENKEKLLNFIKENKLNEKEFNKVSKEVLEVSKKRSLVYI